MKKNKQTKHKFKKKLNYLTKLTTHRRCDEAYFTVDYVHMTLHMIPVYYYYAATSTGTGHCEMTSGVRLSVCLSRASNLNRQRKDPRSPKLTRWKHTTRVTCEPT